MNATGTEVSLPRLFTALLTLIVWLACVGVGVSGTILETEYTPRAKLPPAKPPAKLIHVALTNDAPSTAFDNSAQANAAENQLQSHATAAMPPPAAVPPPPETIPPPPAALSALAPLAAPALVPVAAPANVRFAIPVNAPVLPQAPPAHSGVNASNAAGNPAGSAAGNLTGSPDFTGIAGTGTPGVPTLLQFGVGAGAQPAPEYPARALTNRQQGTVRVRFAVDENGTVSDVEVVSPCRFPLLNESATYTVSRHWLFPPGPPRLYEVDIKFILAQ
jgi:protein TonB